ncbi:MAG: hypothetical protein NT075_00175 [Chloroflexi bacterium]|nr:hypothetical protein [Chloroflexota bacterium]
MATNQFVISIMSSDRVGIVSDVASQISALQGDIADLSQTVLRGYFTMILMATFPEATTTAAIKAQLTAISAPDAPALEVTVLPVGASALREEAVAPENIYILTASGGDRIGFVATVASFCAKNAINIRDLATSVSAGQYSMVLQVDLSRCASVRSIQRELKLFAQQHEIQLVLQHNDIFQAIHEINMPG